MKKIRFNLLLLLYSLLMAIMITEKIDVIYAINAVIFYVSGYFAYALVRFFTEVIENQLYCEEYIEFSPYLGSFILVNFFGRLGLFFLNLNSYLPSEQVVLYYFIVNILTLVILHTVMIKRATITGIQWFKTIMMSLPIVVYLVLDVMSFRGGLQ